MKHIIILGDGMSDHPVGRIGGKTPLEYASTPAFDELAKMGRSGSLVTIPEGLQPGSEVANATILGYDMTKVYEGRGPLEAASIGYDLAPDELALRCNVITLSDGKIMNHHGGHLTTEEGRELITFLNKNLGSDKVKFIPGIQYRHLLIIKGGSKYIECAPPHDHPNEAWADLLVRPIENAPVEEGRLTPRETADLINELILKSQKLLADHPFNKGRKTPANSIWPWSGGYRPAMLTLQEMFPSIKTGAVITAVDLIRGIGKYAGLTPIDVKGATGLADTNYEGKANAAISALRDTDFVFLHVEASDEAGHDGDLDLKIKTIENLDRWIVGPILEEVSKWDEPVAIALMPDHATPVELRVHKGEPVPFTIWYKGISPDEVSSYSEATCANGAYGILKLGEFIQEFMNLKNQKQT
ncbi:MAG: cofactor-independent phosphoglycerate mutase [Muribaculaceae bacterium]|nr:cofactor-independent phosphoglycerate mutase [Muribaculaceae bacterium]